MTVITTTCPDTHYTFLSLSDIICLKLLRSWSVKCLNSICTLDPFLQNEQLGHSTIRTDILTNWQLLDCVLKDEVFSCVIISRLCIKICFLVSGRREDSEDKGSLPNRKTVTSVLRFRPDAGDNLANIACEAQHPALTREPLRAYVKMFVQCKCTATQTQTDNILRICVYFSLHYILCFLQIPRACLRSRDTKTNKLWKVERQWH